MPDEAILHADHLGSLRVRANLFSPVIRCRDLYSPFGQKQTAPCDAHRAGFTGKERDGETGFDYFGARYYAPTPFSTAPIRPIPRAGTAKVVFETIPSSLTRPTYSLL